MMLNKTVRVITLCGSAKFKKKWIEVSKNLIESGYFVRSIEIFSKADNIKLNPEFRNFLEQLHLEKIDQSDAIFVINPNGYIGESTSKEIKYAESKKKQIFFLE